MCLSAVYLDVILDIKGHLTFPKNKIIENIFLITSCVCFVGLIFHLVTHSCTDKCMILVATVCAFSRFPFFL